MRVAILLAAGLVAAPSATSVRFQFADGRLLPMRGRIYVWCGRWDDGTRVRTLRIQQSSPLAPPWWSIEIRLTLAKRGRRFALPTLNGRTASVFVGDPRTAVEVSSDVEPSRGSLTVLSNARCEPGSAIRLRIHALLASEAAGGRPLRVDGTFAGTVGRTPAPGVEP